MWGVLELSSCLPVIAWVQIHEVVVSVSFGYRTKLVRFNNRRWSEAVVSKVTQSAADYQMSDSCLLIADSLIDNQLAILACKLYRSILINHHKIHPSYFYLRFLLVVGRFAFSIRPDEPAGSCDVLLSLTSLLFRDVNHLSATRWIIQILICLMCRLNVCYLCDDF